MPRLTTKTKTIVAVIALFSAVIFPNLTFCQEMEKSYAISGVYVNNGHLYGIFGYAHRASQHISYFVQSESGGNEYAFGGFPVATFGLSKRITIGALLGPQVEIVQEAPTTSETITYLGATTGIVGIYQVTDHTAIWLGCRYMFIDEFISPFKIGAGLILAIK